MMNNFCDLFVGSSCEALDPGSGEDLMEDLMEEAVDVDELKSDKLLRNRSSYQLIHIVQETRAIIMDEVWERAMDAADGVDKIGFEIRMDQIQRNNKIKQRSFFMTHRLILLTDLRNHMCSNLVQMVLYS
ncbi:hypothetical protein WICPIJ_002879 [Wickerhamomyces pijperi]|uniref:Uncharacterized protein n=1 Tax=Wickerhamomyces pijperi TaxID=599730 RepID=A0A9P8Q8X9_WICPI|nr:hypothetical protein WICPIJ_002879 [Wickerhamomyces pijperi]